MTYRRAVWLLRVVGELAIDLLRGHLERKPEPARGLPFRDAERQARASRNAGHEPPATIPRRR